MKTLYTLLILFFTGILVAQTPSGIHYQAALRDASGNTLKNEDVTIKVTVRTHSGPTYNETINTRTNNFGIFNVVIGTHGMPDVMKNMDWGSGDGEIELSIESSKGNINLGTKRFQSIPYAFYADKAGRAEHDEVNDADADPNNEIQMLSYNPATRELTLSKGNTITLPASSSGDNWGTQKVESGATLSGDGTAANPLNVVGDLTDDQQLSITGDQLSISGGNTVTVPDASSSNELQNLSFVPGTQMLSISNGNTVDLSSLKDSVSNLWKQTPIGIYALNDVYVNHTDSVPALHLSPSAIDFHVPFPDKTSVWSPDGVWFEDGNKHANVNADSVYFRGYGFRSRMSKNEVIVEGPGIDTYTKNIHDSLGFKSTISGFNNGYTMQNPFSFTASSYGNKGIYGSEGLYVDDSIHYLSLDKNHLEFGDKGLGSYANLFGRGFGALALANGGNWAAVIATARNGAGTIETFGISGGTNAYLGYSSNAYKEKGALLLYDNQKVRTSIRTTSQGEGTQYLYGPNNKANIIFTGYYQPTTSGVIPHPNNGSILVCDNNGSPKGGIYVNSSGQGVVWGDIKSFVVKHPTKKNVDIWYASLEGPEVAAYDRGTATLKDGELKVPLSEHFKAIANTNTMTVILTPHSTDTYGLAVVKKGSDGFVVKELKGGKGNFSFDWEVKCKRLGREDFQVERPRNNRFMPPQREK